MVKSCCICRCESYRGCGVSFFMLPTNEETRKKWLAVIPKMKKYSAVCNRHFRYEDFMSAALNKLNPGAVPSILEQPWEKKCRLKYCLFTSKQATGNNNDKSNILNNDLDKAGEDEWMSTGDDVQDVYETTSKDVSQCSTRDDAMSNFSDDLQRLSVDGIISSDEDKECQQTQEIDEDVTPRLHEGFRCNNCGGNIEGFRYTCVQCVDFDMCAACEGDRKHSQHYMLRIPKPTPFNVVQSLLEAIRNNLDGGSRGDCVIVNDSSVDVDSMKTEVKEEPDDLLSLLPDEEIEEHVVNESNPKPLVLTISPVTQGNVHIKTATPSINVGNAKKHNSTPKVTKVYDLEKASKRKLIVSVSRLDLNEHVKKAKNIDPVTPKTFTPVTPKTFAPDSPEAFDPDSVIPINIIPKKGQKFEIINSTSCFENAIDAKSRNVKQRDTKFDMIGRGIWKGRKS